MRLHLDKSIDEIVKNKNLYITQKKSTPIFGAIVNDFSPATKTVSFKSDGDVVHVKVIANLANWFDSDSDVIMADAWKKSISDKGRNIPFLNSHIHTLDAVIGDTTDVYSEDVKMSDLGIDSDVRKSQALIFEADIMKSYNEKIFNMYKSGKVNQHSIGLQYVNLELAVNNEDYKEEKAVWDKYFSRIINKSDVEKQGYFWAVKEIKVFENSAVLFGANSQTPTLETTEAGKSTSTEPERSTQKNLIINLLKI